MGPEPHGRERPLRVRLHLRIEELEVVELARAGLVREFGRTPDLSEAVVWLARRRLEEVRGRPEVRPLRRIEPTVR